MGIMAFFYIIPTQSKAQLVGVLQAHPDNVFVEPTSGGVFWNVLRNDDPGLCLPSIDLKTKIVTPPTRAAYCDFMSGYIYYIPDGTGFAGRDSLVYEIECSGTVSRTKVYINVNNMPENVYPDVCHVPIPKIGWEIQELSRTDDIVTVYGVPLSGDIDNDGEIEILIKQGEEVGHDFGPVSNIYIFGMDQATNQLYLKYTVQTPPVSTGTQFIIADVDGDYASIFLTTDGRNGDLREPRQLIKYKFSSVLSEYEEAWRASYSADTTYSGGIPIIADFAGDGNSQIVVYDKVFDAKTGILLADGGYSGNSFYNFGRSGHTPAYDYTKRIPATSMVAVDIDGDGLPEVIGGDCVYKVTITNHTGTSGNSFTYLRRADATGRADVGNGAIAIADMDLDGQLDVVVTYKMETTSTDSNGSLYIYNPRTGVIMNTNVVDTIPIRPGGSSGIHNAAGPSVPFIGDVNNDGKPEIALTGRYIMQTYSYDAATKILSKIWERTTTDESASTTMSLFDFTQSGNAQLVYRDQDSLRIIDGATGITLSGFYPSKSPTVDEYPIIADVNGDGAAEIIIASSEGAAKGSLRVYASASTPWASARSVWNQFSYNPVYINDDLTIPRYPLNPATPFINSDTITRPFNNFLQQATILNDKGLMLYLGPDLQFDPLKRPTFVLNDVTDELNVNIRIGNVGDADFIPPLKISTYVYDTPTDTYKMLHSVVTNDTVKVNKTKDITYIIPGYSSLPYPSSFDRWYIFLNDNDNGTDNPLFPYAADECAYWNNRSSNISFTYGERVMCQDSTEIVTLDPSGVYDYRWYDVATGGTPVGVGDNWPVTKDANVLQRYFIDTYSKTTGVKLNVVRDTVNVYLTPDTLVWNGKINSDWHNFENWTNPNAPIIDPYPMRNVPRKCTNVLIPDSLVTYPDLSNVEITGTGTSYEDYLRSECANIWFEHGGEVKRTDTLDYDAAYVYLRLNANRWYMLSAPLRSMFTGDYYEVDPNPLKDNVEVYTRLYRSANPENGESDTDAWGWTGVFHNPNVEMPAGQGISFWLDNKQDINTITSHQFLFPKYDDFYNVYARAGHVVYTAPISRKGMENRFVYENDSKLPPSNGKVPLASSSSTSNEQVIVGNPFMTHLDFNQFYSANSAYIKNYYQVLDKTDGVFVTYTRTGENTGTGTGLPALTRYIAPMQSVLMESRTAFPSQTLFADVKSVLNVAGAKLRISEEDEPKAQTLAIEVSRGTQMNKSLLMYSPDYDETNESIGKTFLKQFTEAITVYTRNPKTGKYLDIQKIDNLENTIIPLGIRTSKSGAFRLNFSGLSSFAPEYGIYLNDLETQKSYNLRQGSIHVFEKTNAETFNNRFTLSFIKYTTRINTPNQPNNTIEVYCRNGVLEVSTTNNESLQSVEIYDLQGRLVSTAKHLQSKTYNKTLPKNALYIVKVQSDSQIRNVKVVN